MHSATEKRLYAILLGLLVLAGAALRLAHLGEPSLWWDEFITLGIARLPLARMLHTLAVVGPSDIGGEFFPPLYHLTTHAVLAVSPSDAALRTLSVVCGTASIAALYALAGAVFSRRAGLFAAALAAFSVYQMHYSRELRPYSLFMLLALLSLLALYRALTKGGLIRWALYALAVAAMCYTSYMATTNIAAQGLFALYFLVQGLARRDFDRARAVRLALCLGVALAVAGLCYLPWLPAYRNVFILLKSGGGSPGIPADFAWTTLAEFGAYAAPPRGLPWLPLALAALVGLGMGLRRQNRLGLALFGLWAVMPLVAFLAAGTSLELSSRYVFNAFYFLLAMAGLGLAAMLDRLLAYLQVAEAKAKWAAPLAGLAACLLVSVPNIASLPDYYRRETSYNKELADFLAWNKNNVGFLFFQSNRNPKLITRWYLPGVFDDLSTYAPKGYKRAFHLLQSDLSPTLAPYPPRLLTRIQDNKIYAMGLVGTAPVALYPDASGAANYLEDFTTYRFYADCDAAENLAPDTRYHTLSHYDADKPGHVLYRFVAASGTSLQSARLTLSFAAQFLEGVPSDSRVTVSAAADDGPWQALDIITGQSFIGPDGRLVPANVEKRRFITRTYDIPGLPAAKQVRLRLDYGPVANLAGQPQGPGSAEAALWRAADHNALATWRPGISLVAGNALYAFPAAPDLPQGPANPAGALPAFLAVYPGIEPVFTIANPDGSPAYHFFDPALIDPFLHLEPGRPAQASLGNRPSLDIAALKLAGAFNRPRLTVDGQSLSIPVLSPAGSTLELNAKAAGVLRFEPSFSQEAQALAAFPLAENIRKNEGEDCLACREARPCSVTVPISSAYPIKLLRIAAYPRIFADKAGQNSVRMAFSLDGKAFRTLDTLRSNRSGLWEGLMSRRMAVLRFDKPITNCFVRFELSGPGTQLWSKDDVRMRIEAVLDASAFAGPAITHDDFTVTLDDNGNAPLSVYLSPKPLPYRPGLQDNF